MDYQAKTPEDMIADDASFAEKNGTVIRKGTMAAVLANAEIIEADDSTAEQKAAALQVIKQLAPALTAMGLMKFMRWNNPAIQKIFDEDNDSA